MRKAVWNLVVSGLIFSLAVTPSMAAKGANPKGPKKDADSVFTKLDANNDGKVSLEEFEKARGKSDKGKGKGVAAIFKKLDKDGDGFLNKEELTAKPDKTKKKP